MSEYLQNLLMDVKKKAKALEVVPARDGDSNLEDSTDEPVDKSLLITKSTGIPGIPGIRGIPDETGIPGIPDKQGAEKTSTGIPGIPDKQAGNVSILSNFMKFDLDLFPVLFDLTDPELRTYLFLFKESYGQYQPRNICHATRRIIQDVTNISSPNSQLKALRGLEARGLIKRLITSKGKGEMSLYRIYLPCEVPDLHSKTKIRYSGHTG